MNAGGEALGDIVSEEGPFDEDVVVPLHEIADEGAEFGVLEEGQVRGVGMGGDELVDFFDV